MQPLPNSPFMQPSAAVRRVTAYADACLEVCRAYHEQKTGEPDLPLPIPVDTWIEAPLGIRFGVTDLSDRGERVLGACAIPERRILVSELITHPGRYRFTCAHELGHMVMHRRYGKAFTDRDVGGAPRTEFLDWQADRFASAFLMPLGPLIRELLAACRDAGMDVERCVAELAMPSLEGEWLWRKHVLPAMVGRFGVSRMAAVYRFRDLRLMDRRPFLLDRQARRLLNPRRWTLLSRFRLVGGYPVRAPQGRHKENAD